MHLKGDRGDIIAEHPRLRAVLHLERIERQIRHTHHPRQPVPSSRASPWRPPRCRCRRSNAGPIQRPCSESPAGTPARGGAGAARSSRFACWPPSGRSWRLGAGGQGEPGIYRGSACPGGRRAALPPSRPTAAPSTAQRPRRTQPRLAAAPPPRPPRSSARGRRGGPRRASDRAARPAPTIEEMKVPPDSNDASARPPARHARPPAPRPAGRCRPRARRDALHAPPIAPAQQHRDAEEERVQAGAPALGRAPLSSAQSATRGIRT